jgi:hypothetical protein
MPDFADLPVCQEWPPASPHRKVGTVRGDNGRWYVLVDDPLETQSTNQDADGQVRRFSWYYCLHFPEKYFGGRTRESWSFSRHNIT